MPSKYDQIWDGEWFDLERSLKLRCCDCGLVHDIKLRVMDGKLRAKFERNNRRTAACRREMMKQRKRKSDGN